MSAITTVEFERPTLPSETYLSELGDDGPPFTISGVALGDNDVTKGKSGIKKMWPAEELERAADTLQGTSLVVNHQNTAEGVVGRVTKAGYKQGTGVIYEAELYDEDLAEKVDDGLLEVSVRGLHADVENLEEDSDSGAIKVEDIQFKNLSIVPSGAAPSNTLSMGTHEELSEAELSAFTETLATAELESDIEPGMWVEGDGVKGITISQIQDGDIEVDIYEEQDGQWRSTEETKMVSTDSLDEWDVDEDDIGPAPDKDEGEDKDEEENASVSEGDYVSWDSSGGRAFGRVEEVRTDSDITNDEIKGDGGPINASEDEPAVLIEVWQDGEGSGTMVGHKMSSVDVIEKSTVEEEASAISRGESGDKLDETEQMPVQGLDKSDDAPQPSDDQESTDESMSGSQRYTEGQMVKWQAVGEVAHNPEDQDIVMVEMMLQRDGELQTTGLTGSVPTEALELVEDADGEERLLATGDVPVQSAEPDHEPMGADDESTLANVTLEEMLKRVDELAIRSEGAEIVLDDHTSIAGMQWNSPERFTRDDIDTDKLDIDTAISPTADLAQSYDDYPEAASENAQMALDAREETDNPNDCGTDVGWKRANQLANGEGLTREQVGKMSAFARHEGNSDMDDDEGKTDCGWMMWKAWGGDEGVEWAQRKLDEIEEEASADEGIDVTELSDVEEELQDYEMHEPSWDGTTEQDWSTPDMEDFDTDDLSEIAEHFIISSSGFPPENFGDLKLPIVEPSGELNVNALAAVKGGRGASAVDGLSSEMEDEIVSMVNELANDKFDRDWGKEEEAMEDISVPADHQFSSEEDAMSFVEDMDGVSGVHKMEIDGETVWVPGDDHEEYTDIVAEGSKHGDDEEEEMSKHSIEGTTGEPTASKTVGGVRVLPGDDLQQAIDSGASAADSLSQHTITTMNDEIEEQLSELDEPVAVEAEELSELQDKADRFEELSENIEAIRERTEILDDVSREQVEELAESEDAVVVESARFEELQSEAEQVKTVYAASLAEEMPGFEAEELADSFSIEELREKHEAVVGDIEEELSADTSDNAEPRSTDPSEEELEEASDDVDKEEEELEDAAEQKREEIRSKIFSDR